MSEIRIQDSRPSRRRVLTPTDGRNHRLKGRLQEPIEARVLFTVLSASSNELIAVCALVVFCTSNADTAVPDTAVVAAVSPAFSGAVPAIVIALEDVRVNLPYPGEELVAACSPVAIPEKPPKIVSVLSVVPSTKLEEITRFSPDVLEKTRLSFSAEPV